METTGSERLQELAHSKHWDLVTDAADTSCAVTHDGDEHLCFENGFDLAMKVVQMGALAQYAGKSLIVFHISAPDDEDAYAYFVAADEDEVCARLAPLEDKPAPTPDEDEDEDGEE
jgi:hypothetical protein